MENKEKEFDLIPVLELNTKTYQIERFDEVKAACEMFIQDKISELDLSVLEDYTFKDVKAVRTEIRKKQEQIKKVRIDCNFIAMGTFNDQAKTLETMLKEADDTLRDYVSTYEKEVQGKLDKPLKITLTVKGYDVKKIEKVREFAIKQGLEVAIK